MEVLSDGRGSTSNSATARGFLPVPWGLCRQEMGLLENCSLGSATELPDTQGSQPLGCSITAMKIPSERAPRIWEMVWGFKGEEDDSATGWSRRVATEDHINVSTRR